MKNRRKMRLNLIFAIGLSILWCVSCNKETEMQFLNDWDEDVFFFADQLKAKHPDLFHQLNETEFNADIRKLRNRAGTLPESDLLIELFKIIAKIGDSHTGLDATSRLQFLPIRFEWTSDGIVVIAVPKQAELHLGQVITGINNIPIASIIDSFRTVIAYENESRFRGQLLSFLRVREIYDHFGFTDSTMPVTLHSTDNATIPLRASESELVFLYDRLTLPLYLRNTSDPYWFETLEQNHLIYIQYNSARERNDWPFQQFTDQIINRINTDTAIAKVAIDLRLNGGGNSAVAKPLIEAMKQLVSDGRLQARDVYIIIGRRTFSSALLNAWEFKQAFGPVLIGEPTGGKPNHFGEVRNFLLPNSRLKIFHSTKFFKINPEDDDSLVPDLLIELSSEDIINGRDPVLEEILLR